MNPLRWLLVWHSVIILIGLLVSIYLNRPGFLIGILGGLLLGARYGPRIISRNRAVKKD